MKSAQLHEHAGQRTFIVVLGEGEEAMNGLQQFVAEHRVGAAHFTAIGAFSRVTVAFFDRATRRYENTNIDEQVEVLSLVGDVSIDGDVPKVHAHVVLGKRDASAHGGHLIRGDVWPTLEVMLTEAPRHLWRRFDPASGLSLIDPQAGPPAG
jgi:predicted DNA-binding protein with PD1-like motif